MFSFVLGVAAGVLIMIVDSVRDAVDNFVDDLFKIFK